MRLSLILAFLILPFAALADDLPPLPDGGVLDLAELVPAADEARLRTLIRDIRAETGVELVVITMEQMADHGGGGQKLEAYATRLFNHWGLGDAKRNDGILLLVASGDRATRIELGTGYSSAYDARAQKLVDKAMLPNFRERQMAKGILAGVTGIQDEIARPFANGSRLGLRDYLIILAFGAWSVGLTLMRRRAEAARLSCPGCSKPSLTRENEVAHAATLFSSGQGVTHIRCGLCGYSEDRTFKISAKISFGGSGGGSGGGRSSGGGASGRW